MNIFDDYTFSVLAELNNTGVEYLVIGGYAVNYHGYNRTTGDIDLWIKPSNENKENLILALSKLEIDDSSINELRNLNFEEHVSFSDGIEPYKIDFITRINGVNFEEAWPNRIIYEIDQLAIPLINLNDLVLSKFNTGRLKDQLDIEELQKIQEIKNKK